MNHPIMVGQDLPPTETEKAAARRAAGEPSRFLVVSLELKRELLTAEISLSLKRAATLEERPDMQADLREYASILQQAVAAIRPTTPRGEFLNRADLGAIVG